MGAPTLLSDSEIKWGQGIFPAKGGVEQKKRTKIFPAKKFLLLLLWFIQEGTARVEWRIRGGILHQALTLLAAFHSMPSQYTHAKEVWLREGELPPIQIIEWDSILD